MRAASGEPGAIDKADMRPSAGERTKLRRGAAAVRIQYRAGSGEAIDTTLDRVKLDELTKGLPVREFRWYRGRMHYSGWYWSSIPCSGTDGIRGSPNLWRLQTPDGARTGRVAVTEAASRAGGRSNSSKRCGSWKTTLRLIPDEVRLNTCRVWA